MKTFGRLAALGAVMAASSVAFAGTYTLGSFGDPGLFGYAPPVAVANTEVVLSADQLFLSDSVGCGADPHCLPPIGVLTPVGTNSVDLDPALVWHLPLTNSSWVGVNKNSGPVSTSNPQYGYYKYTTTFSAIPGTYGGSINVLADDTVAAFLNGTMIVNFGAPGNDLHCAQALVTCLAPDPIGLNVSLLASNELDFIVEQLGDGPVGGTGDPTGFDFVATLTQTPEPSSLMLLGTGLVGAAGLLFRRRVSA